MEFENSLIEHFSQVTDPRIDRTKKHNLIDIIIVTICAILSDCDSWIDIVDWAKENEEWLSDFLELPHGIPSHDTFGRVFAILKKSLVQAESAKLLAERLNEERDGLVSLIVHDFKTPLNVIVSAHELMKTLIENNQEISTSKSSDILELLNMMGQSTHSMFELVNDLIDYNQLNRDNFQLKLALTKFCPILESVIEQQFILANKKAIKINTSIKKDLIGLANAHYLQRAIQNLLDNAIKYSPFHTSIDIELFTNCSHLILTIKDQGPGIDKSDHDKIFKPFYQTRNRPTGAEKSSGLGLATVALVARVHKGSIRLESERGHGTKFILEIPLNLEEQKHNNHQQNFTKLNSENESVGETSMEL